MNNKIYEAFIEKVAVSLSSVNNKRYWQMLKELHGSGAKALQVVRSEGAGVYHIADSAKTESTLLSGLSHDNMLGSPRSVAGLGANRAKLTRLKLPSEATAEGVRLPSADSYRGYTRYSALSKNHGTASVGSSIAANALKSDRISSRLGRDITEVSPYTNKQGFGKISPRGESQARRAEFDAKQTPETRQVFQDKVNAATAARNNKSQQTQPSKQQQQIQQSTPPPQEPKAQQSQQSTPPPQEPKAQQSQQSTPPPQAPPTTPTQSKSYVPHAVLGAGALGAGAIAYHNTKEAAFFNKLAAFNMRA